ncbi:translation initiation factor SUI1 [Multifurca ochricompacta]|uniref:Translation initiation factor SUI1 n=1 Tax=Multifurca ochricompacta TaxID=376703 RepID=A0AAD4MAM7_9AGAM|nr:translation initiation factor SUI1 [Multifurca ochricompacta]
MSVQNLNTFGLYLYFHPSYYPTHSSPDPFADAADPLAADEPGRQSYIHIRIQQRNGRKTLTTLQGLPKEYDAKKLLKAFKKEFACNGTLVDDEEMGQVLQLQGDQRAKIFAFLTENGISRSSIKLHGF